MTINEFKEKWLFDARYEFCNNCKYCEIKFPNHLICNHPDIKSVDGMLVDETSYCDAWEENDVK